MRTFQAACAAAAFLALAGPASAQVALGGNYGADWFQFGRGLDQEQALVPSMVVAYDIPTAEDGMSGLSFAYRALSSGEPGDGALVHEVRIEVWKQVFGGTLEVFGGGKTEAWDQSLIGDTKFLGGGEAGFRFPILNVPFEVSGHYAIGTESVKHFGGTFGIRLSNNPPEE